jgi:uncharacterized membrane protein YciS (DUF1049 family)
MILLTIHIVAIPVISVCIVAKNVKIVSFGCGKYLDEFVPQAVAQISELKCYDL